MTFRILVLSVILVILIFVIIIVVVFIILIRALLLLIVIFINLQIPFLVSSSLCLLIATCGTGATLDDVFSLIFGR